MEINKLPQTIDVFKASVATGACNETDIEIIAVDRRTNPEVLAYIVKTYTNEPENSYTRRSISIGAFSNPKTPENACVDVILKLPPVIYPELFSSNWSERVTKRRTWSESAMYKLAEHFEYHWEHPILCALICNKNLPKKLYDDLAEQLSAKKYALVDYKNLSYYNNYVIYNFLKSKHLTDQLFDGMMKNSDYIPYWIQSSIARLKATTPRRMAVMLKSGKLTHYKARAIVLDRLYASKLLTVKMKA